MSKEEGGINHSSQWGHVPWLHGAAPSPPCTRVLSSCFQNKMKWCKMGYINSIIFIAIHKALPDHVKVWIDANAGWNLDQALTFAPALGSDITVPLEQPCRSLSDCTEVGRRTGLPIILDESVVTIADLVAAHAAGITGLNMKPSRVGGLSKARTIRGAAVALDMMVTWDDTWGCALLTAQNLQLAVSTRRDRLRAVDLFAEWTNPLVADVPRMKSNGRVECSALPGNGFGNVNIGLLSEPLFLITAER